MRNYERFLRDSFSELNPDVILEAKEEKNKADVYKENYFLKKNLQDAIIAPELSKSSVRDSIINFTGKFIDDNATKFSTSGPVYMITFGDKEVNFFYEIFNTTPEYIMELYNKMIDETYYGKISEFLTGLVRHAQHKIIFVSILIESVMKGYDDLAECCQYLLAFADYPMIYRRYWATGVREDVMNYTIEHLGNKFVIKRVKNLLEFLKYDANVAVTAFDDVLKTGVDNVYIDLIYRIRSQINSKFRNISTAYYDNIELNASQHNKTSTFDDGQLADSEGINTNISSLVEKTVNKFSTGGINNSLIRVSADGRQVDRGNLHGYISQIMGGKNNNIHKFIENVLTIYFSRNPTSQSAGSGEFISFGLTLYRSISTSKDPLMAELKSILNFWMFEVIDIRSQYQREATVISYTRAVFDYMIFMINYYNN